MSLTPFCNGLATADILSLFADDVKALGGKVTDKFDDGGYVFARATLPRASDVVPGDRYNPGVALRATVQDVFVHPYVFRQVCTNGAIMAHATDSRHIRLGDLAAPVTDFPAVLASAVRACCELEVFATAMEDLRGAVTWSVDRNVDMLINLMPLLSRIPSSHTVVAEIFKRFAREPVASGYALTNAVTLVARDTKDPQTRWRLEELGGAIPTMTWPQRRPWPTSARRAEPVGAA